MAETGPYTQVNSILSSVNTAVTNATSGISAGSLWGQVTSFVSAAPPSGPPVVSSSGYIDPGYGVDRDDTNFVLNQPEIKDVTVTVGKSESKYEDVVSMLDKLRDDLSEIGLVAPEAPTKPALDLWSPVAPDTSTLRPGEFDDNSLVDVRPKEYSKVDNPVPIPTLRPIEFRTISAPVLTTFSDIAPVFEGAEPSDAAFQWNERTYVERFLPKVTTALNGVLDTGSGLPDGLEVAIFDRAREREDMLSRKASEEAYSAFAARGFDMPQGMLVEQLNGIVEDNQLKSRGFNREVFTKRMEWELDQFKFAVQQGLALEQMSFEIFKDMASRAFEAAKAKLDIELKVFEGYIQLFNAKQGLYQTKANVYKTVIDAQLRELDIYKIEAEIEDIKTRANRAEVDTYVAGFQAVTANVEVYKALVDAAKVGNEINQQKIDAHRTKIQAWEAFLGAEKTRVDGELGYLQAQRIKGDIYSGELKAYGDYVQSTAQKIGAFVQLAGGYVDAGKMETQWHDLDLAQTRLQSEYDKVQAELSLMSEQARIKGIDMVVERDLSHNKLEADVYRAMVDGATASAQASLASATAQNNANLEAYKLGAEYHKVKAEVYSRALQGALSAVHLSQSISGSAGISGSGSTSVSYSYSGDVNSDVSPMASA